jgi:N-carbamoyl-L-amino-acid hydrolase
MHMKQAGIQMQVISINPDRLLTDIRTLGAIGRDEGGRLTRLAATDADRRGRDTFVQWSRAAGLDVRIDSVGNIFAIWAGRNGLDRNPLLIGSHIDTVIDAGVLDGCYGVLAGLEVIRTLRERIAEPARPVIVAAFTNEEGVRFAPDMMGSAVFAGALSAGEALAATGTDGAVLGEELARIGYAGTETPGFFRPEAYLELHIEQGPVLEREAAEIGVVEDLQGISWQRIVITGEANHAGTTPMSMRRDAGHAAARVIGFLHDLARAASPPLVATVGCLGLSPGAINVVPGKATLTVDMRSPDARRLGEGEAALATFLGDLAEAGRFAISTTRLARTEPVRFDARLAKIVEESARDLGLSSRRMTSGAGHDAQMLSAIAPSVMIFVPSIGGISHNPREDTREQDLVSGANVLLRTAERLLQNGVQTSGPEKPPSLP